MAVTPEPLLPLPGALPQMKPWAELSPRVRQGLARLYRTTEAEAEAAHEKHRALVEETRRVLAERSPQPSTVTDAEVEAALAALPHIDIRKADMLDALEAAEKVRAQTPTVADLLPEPSPRMDVLQAAHDQALAEKSERTGTPLPMNSRRRMAALRAGKPLNDAYGNPLTLTGAGEWVNSAGHAACPHCGEMTNVSCWQCGWTRKTEGLR